VPLGVVARRLALCHKRRTMLLPGRGPERVVVPSRVLTDKSGVPTISDDERRRLWRLAALPLALALLIYVGQILSGFLLTRSPLVLLALNATDPFLLLVAHEASIVGFMAVGAVRLFLPDLFLYQIGHDYGPNTKAFLEAELGNGDKLTGALDWLERWFPRIGLVLLFAIPGYPMCLLSGIARLNRGVFIVVNLAGTMTRLTLVWWVSSAFSGPIGRVVNFISKYSLAFTFAMVALVVFQTSRAANKNAPETETE
jgi:membrane protein YqaA with SNARE-associated domain